MQEGTDQNVLTQGAMPVTIVDEKNSIVNNILVATAVLGGVTAVVTLVRDVANNVSVLNSSINLLFVAGLFHLWVFGKKIQYEIKTWIILIVFIFIGCKSLIVNGQAGHGFNFFLFASMVALMSFGHTRTRWIIITCTLLYLITSGFFVFGVLVPLLPQSTINTPAGWFAEIALFVFLLFIIIAGVGRMQESFKKSINELDESNQRLNQYNEELRNQLEYSKQMENKATEKESNFKALFDESNDGIIVCDANGGILEANKAISNLLGYPKTFLVGNHASEFVAIGDKDSINQMVIDKIHKAKIREMSLLTKDGSRIPIEVNYSVIKYNEEKSVLVTVRDIRERKETEQKVLSAVIRAEENERSRFATDLHDDLGPILSSIKMYIQSLRRYEDSDEKKELINRLIGTVDDSVKSIRKISYNLSSYLLQNLGLTNALKTHVERINMSGPFQVSFQHNFPDEFRLSSNVEIVTYRVVLELINNSIKHSGGDKINIAFQIHDNHFTIDYFDNGTGFNVNEMLQDNSKGIGLKNIISRVKSIKGLLSYPAAQKGFSVSIDITL